MALSRKITLALLGMSFAGRLHRGMVQRPRPRVFPPYGHLVSALWSIRLRSHRQVRGMVPLTHTSHFSGPPSGRALPAKALPLLCSAALPAFGGAAGNPSCSKADLAEGFCDEQ